MPGREVRKQLCLSTESVLFSNELHQYGTSDNQERGCQTRDFQAHVLSSGSSWQIWITDLRSAFNFIMKLN